MTESVAYACKFGAERAVVLK